MGIFEVWGNRDPAAAMSKARSQEQEIAVLKGWAEQDSAAALEWARGNLSGSSLGLFLKESSADLKGSEVQALLAGNPGLVVESKIESASENPSLVDPESTFEGARNRGEDPGALNSILKTWLEHDDTRYVFDWVKEELANSPEIQQTMVNTWVDRDPAEGADLLKANQMDGVLTQLMEKWKAVDPDGARAYSGK